METVISKSLWNHYVCLGLLGLYGISTIVGYLMQNSFLLKKAVLFQTIQELSSWCYS